MPSTLEADFHEAMLNVYRRAKAEAAYKATLFLQMFTEQGGVQAVRALINSRTVSSGYTALWERGRLDLTVEAVVVQTPRYHALFTKEEIETCEDRLRNYGYEL